MFSIPIVPVLVVRDASKAQMLGRLLVECGLPIAEVTLRTPCALEVIEEMSGIEGLTVGAGTVLTAANAKDAVKAGASFLVSPALHEEAILEAQKLNVPIVPGVATPSEIARAMALGLETVKFFPAEVIGGLPLLKALGSVYPEMKIMPTGGIGPSNVKDYLALPNVIACGGSWMVPANLVEEGNEEELARLIREAVAKVS
jgi:2-dehydro-3-deoxyphosphogluconate aldolase/(4S)-4-hydroxy-2-oxoglutarate aldolase